ncbi:FIST signal transduction protein [Marinifilum sp.]|uniref:FIST signal transduction protein n=1 Tax=Marinifilum sp. TaxID=2033137 RepID=UPI003BAA4F49
MKIEKLVLKTKEEFKLVKNIKINPNLIFLFGSRELLVDEHLSQLLLETFGSVKLFGCSSSGEISGIEVIENSIILTAVELECSKVQMESIVIDNQVDDHQLGTSLLKKFEKKGLKHIFILSDGLNINGADLVYTLDDELPKEVNITGGMAADGIHFKETVVFNKHGKAVKNCIAALGFYGDCVKVGYGSGGGYDSFGLERMVTKSKANILYELDGIPALKYYKHFLGDMAEQLPASGLLYPLSVRENSLQEPVVRSVIAINEEDQSLVFAGNVPEGSYVKLMKSNVDRLINGAEDAAITASKLLPKNKAELAFLISCTGRKQVLKQLAEEEVEAVSDVIGNDVCITGFYSYGEISPFRKNMPCMLHNQTMAITTISEK